MRTLATLIVIGMLLVAAPAMADNTCEVDGEAGLTTAWGECMTPSLYDELFSYDNLSGIASLTSDQSIAAEAGIVDDTPSERPVGEGLIEEGWTFVERVQWWHDSGAQ